jgi:hypothetical protein
MEKKDQVKKFLLAEAFGLETVFSVSVYTWSGSPQSVPGGVVNVRAATIPSCWLGFSTLWTMPSVWYIISPVEFSVYIVYPWCLSVVRENQEGSIGINDLVPLVFGPSHLTLLWPLVGVMFFLITRAGSMTIVLSHLWHSFWLSLFSSLMKVTSPSRNCLV